MVERPEPARHTTGGLRVTEGIHANGSGIPWHEHDTPTICFVRQGAFREYLRGQELFCRPASVKFTPAGERHANRFDLGDAYGVMVEVEPRFTDALHPLGDVLSEARQFEGGLVGGVAAQLARELDRADETSGVALEGWVAELVAVAGRRRAPASGSGGAWLARARDILQAEFSQPLGLAALAARVEVHPVTLARGFRRAYGCPVGEYLRRLRLDWAAGRLIETDEPLAAIAASAGFADQSHFCRVFRRETGQAPAEWRGRRSRGATRGPRVDPEATEQPPEAR
jgi:AraC family transcriptional regulator